jgi:hypothetical protein
VSWSSPFTAVAGSVLTAAQVNTFIRDNLVETMPSKASTAGSIFTTGSTGSIVERTRVANTVATLVQISSTSFDDPSDEGTSGADPGPEVTAFTSTMALVGYRATCTVPSTTARIEVSYAISGDTEREASKSNSMGYSVSGSASGMNLREGVVDLATLLNPGLNTFTLKYNVSSGTGTVQDRRLWVLPL